MSQGKLNGAVDRSLERAAGERKRSIERPVAPDPELVERASRRRFSAGYKLAIVREADGCTRPGEVGALLRVERRLISARAGSFALLGAGMALAGLAGFARS